MPHFLRLLRCTNTHSMWYECAQTMHGKCAKFVRLRSHRATWTNGAHHRLHSQQVSHRKWVFFMFVFSGLFSFFQGLPLSRLTRHRLLSLNWVFQFSTLFFPFSQSSKAGIWFRWVSLALIDSSLDIFWPIFNFQPSSDNVLSLYYNRSQWTFRSVCQRWAKKHNMVKVA